MNSAKFAITALLFITPLVATTAIAQTVYKSTNPDGSVVYSDHPPANGKIEKTITFADLPSSPVPPPAQAMQSAPSRQAAQPPAPKPQSNSNVVLYVASWCPYCRRAKAWLAQRQINYQEVDIESADGSVAFQQAGKGGGIPFLVVGARHLRGFKPEGYDAFFASR